MQDDRSPLIIAVAPNGARKTKADHPALPITPEELAETAARCLDAGASMIHLHVRDDDQKHSLDVSAYRAAIAAIRARVGGELIIQVTTEAVGIYTPAQQMAMVQELEPEAVSLAVRELCPDDAHEEIAAKFFGWLHNSGISPQYILYSAEDVARFKRLHAAGVIPREQPFVLYVLGRYSAGQTSQPTDLLPFLAEAGDSIADWAMCAFGPLEGACAVTAAGLGGHCRVGFENNMRLANGDVASGNADLVTQVADQAGLMGRHVASPAEARKILGL